MAEPPFDVPDVRAGRTPARPAPGLRDVGPDARGVDLPFDVDEPRLAAAAWSRVAEPGDEVAGALVAHLGAAGALAWLAEAARDPARTLRGGALADLGSSVATARLLDAVARWLPRLDRLDPRRELRVLDRLGGTLLCPGDADWPAGLADLGTAAPFALWVRGRTELAGLTARSVAVVGARASSSYGEHVAADLSAGLTDRGFTVVSGGAYGIDAAAHRGAVAAGGPTVAFLAGGVDRFYPPGNQDLLRRIADGAGAVVSEVPPGSAPFKQRFLARNRLIAAVSRATVVVEAAWRSGALSTARHATELFRPLGAVPGPVTSATSTGCHVLLRDGRATCVTDADEVVELATAIGEAPAGGASDPGASSGGVAAGDGREGRASRERRAAADRAAELGDPARLVWDALPVRASASPESICRTAGLSVRETLAGLGLLEQHGLAEPDGARWRRHRPRRGG
ncbi:DNA-processing protein DprA [Isoptericola hypogeus]|uniref:DNA-processing protein DprA n=1 Tax=Isoptericola hypogeus TaxID=300179 RepID=A0ABN2JHU3_9MICO